MLFLISHTGACVIAVLPTTMLTYHTNEAPGPSNKLRLLRQLTSVIMIPRLPPP